MSQVGASIGDIFRCNGMEKVVDDVPGFERRSRWWQRSQKMQMEVWFGGGGQITIEPKWASDHVGNIDAMQCDAKCQNAVFERGFI